jgi:hypothetical protein
MHVIHSVAEPCTCDLRLAEARSGRSRRTKELGTNLIEAYRQIGIMAGGTLKGEKPGDIPVEQPTEFDLVKSKGNSKTQG